MADAVSACWSEDEDCILLAHYPEHDARWAGWESLLPNRTEEAILARAERLMHTGRRTGKRWRRKEVETSPLEGYVMACLREGMTPSEVDERLGLRPGRCKQVLTKRWGKR